jgi:protein TonB
MFDSVLSKASAPQGNAAGLGLSVAVFGVIVATAIGMSGRVTTKRRHEVDVKFVTAKPAPPPPAAAPPPPPPPPPAAAASKPVEKKPTKKRVEIPKEPKPELVAPPEPKPAEAPPSDTPSSEPGVPGGVPGGVAGGVIGGTVGGVVGGKIGSTVVPFGLGMTRPQKIAGADPQYSREAVAARVEGKVLVRCVITTQGAVEDCKLIKRLPMLDAIAVESLEKSRFTPVMFQGHPTAVQYLFTFNFKLP